MKPTKKNVAQNSMKKKTNDDPVKIKSYFKVAPKQFLVESKNNDVVQREDSNRDIYIQALEEKLKSEVIFIISLIQISIQKQNKCTSNIAHQTIASFYFLSKIPFFYVEIFNPVCSLN